MLLLALANVACSMEANGTGTPDPCLGTTLGQTERVSLDQDDLRFLALGDWGASKAKLRRGQRAVAEAMGRKCLVGLSHQNLTNGQEKGKCDLIITLGDNFYKNGVKSVDDPRFEKVWKKVYTHPSISKLDW